MYIPYGRQSIDEDDIRAVVEVLKSDFLTTGPKIQQFEKRVADYVGAKYAVAVNSGTAALHIACLAAGISENDEVITSPITFAASANCVLYCNGKPVFADIDPDTYNIDVEDIKKKITPNTKAVIPVHFTGQPCDMDEIISLARMNNLIVIEDAAHALGAEYKNRKIGSIADMTCFSFHPVKPITTGEGGMVVTNDEELYKRLILFRGHGITREENQLERNEGAWYYEQQELGYNYRITDIGCALGYSQMDKLDEFIQKRRELAKRYDEGFLGLKGIKIPVQREIALSGWHLYIILVEEGRRKEIFEKLRGEGIGVNVHYLPVYRHPFYRKNGYADTYLENAENFYERAITLPLYPTLTYQEQDYVISTVKRLVQNDAG